MTEGSRQPESELSQENARLKAALTQSVELIKQWHCRAGNVPKRPKCISDEHWQIYFDYAPEMKNIREALKV